jgi:hypothetical protein
VDNYEQRLNSVERTTTEKCSEHRAREIVRDEIKQFSCDEEKVRMIAKEESLNLTTSTQEEPKRRNTTNRNSNTCNRCNTGKKTQSQQPYNLWTERK